MMGDMIDRNDWRYDERESKINAWRAEVGLKPMKKARTFTSYSVSKNIIFLHEEDLKPCA